MNAIGKELLIK